jgi:hypothetical protein
MSVDGSSDESQHHKSHSRDIHRTEHRPNTDPVDAESPKSGSFERAVAHSGTPSSCRAQYYCRIALSYFPEALQVHPSTSSEAFLIWQLRPVPYSYTTLRSTTRTHPVAPRSPIGCDKRRAASYGSLVANPSQPLANADAAFTPP